MLWIELAVCLSVCIATDRHNKSIITITNCSRMLWIELAVCLSVCTTSDRHNKSIITITNPQLIKSFCCSASHRQRYGDRLVGLSVRGVRVDTYLSVVLRLRVNGAVTALACRGRFYLTFPVRTAHQGSTSRPLIDICGGVQFVMDRNTEREEITCKYF